jgi:hypothetical protein
MTYATLSHQPPPTHRLRALLVARGAGALTRSLMALAALLVAGSGAIHYYLWDIAYRHVATIGPLFLLQGTSAVIVALALVTVGRGAVVAAALALMVGTLIGFALVLTTGLFGFTLGFVSGWAYLSLVVEATATIMLSVAAYRLWRTTA